jgi:hypothetical protein
MKYYLISTIFFSLIWLGFSKKPNGKYLVIYDKEFNSHLKFVINFQDSIYSKTFNSGLILKGKISSFDNKSNLVYLIDSNKNQNITSLDSMLQKSFGDPIMELKIQNKDTIKFRTTYSANLRITINSGILLKKR